MHFSVKTAWSKKSLIKHIEYAGSFPHAARLIVSPCLVELFYKTRKLMDPKDVRKNLEILNIKLCPIADAVEEGLFDSYCQVAYKNEFDFADFCLCSVALMFDPVEILTMDKDDMSLAISRAYTASPNKSNYHLRTFS